MEIQSAIDDARRRMIDEQLLARGVRSPRVLAAMRTVPRERFLDSGGLDEAYGDHAAPIDCGQTISQPYIVGLMTEALELSGEETVLEIGTGSGYQTAILAQVAAHVVTIERHQTLADRAKLLLGALGYRNITFIVGDGTAGWPALAPYPRIIVTAAAAQMPKTLVEQLAPGGIMVIPIGGPDAQVLEAVRKVGDRTVAEELAACRFVPFVGAQ